jgi:hypothetical protein
MAKDDGARPAPARAARASNRTEGARSDDAGRARAADTGAGRTPP